MLVKGALLALPFFSACHQYAGENFEVGSTGSLLGLRPTAIALVVGRAANILCIVSFLSSQPQMSAIVKSIGATSITCRKKIDSVDIQNSRPIKQEPYQKLTFKHHVTHWQDEIVKTVLQPKSFYGVETFVKGAPRTTELAQSLQRGFQKKLQERLSI